MRFAIDEPSDTSAPACGCGTCEAHGPDMICCDSCDELCCWECGKLTTIRGSIPLCASCCTPEDLASEGA